MDNISQAATENCYAVIWSYGEICVGCNCCGRIEKGLPMWEARLSYHESELERELNFEFFDDVKLAKIQRENNKLNIKYHGEKIKEYKLKLKK